MMPQGQKSHKTPLNERLWDWLGSTIPTGAGWMLYGRWPWQRRIGAWWLQRWGGAFYYQKPWFRGPSDV